ncbi:hypothetical protein FKP32DRAFT_412110 [Trametes sanguinea]|nr:hypothetical protein FKP32DRAFT_412110 [Trametes sanguinea]
MLPPTPAPSAAKADRKGKGRAVDDDAPPTKRARTSAPQPQASNSELPATPAPAPPSPKGNSKGKGKAVARHATPAAPTTPAAPAKKRTFIARENVGFTCGWNGCEEQVSSKAWEAHMGTVHGVQKNDGWTALEREQRKCMHEDCVAARAAGKTSKDKMNSWASVLRHYRTKHQQPKLYKCAVCAKEFDRKDSGALGRHTRDKKCKPQESAPEGIENAPPAPAVAGSSSSAAAPRSEGPERIGSVDASTVVVSARGLKLQATAHVCIICGEVGSKGSRQVGRRRYAFTRSRLISTGRARRPFQHRAGGRRDQQQDLHARRGTGGLPPHTTRTRCPLTASAPPTRGCSLPLSRDLCLPHPF